ncbi:MAG: NADP-dependent oxidoreductase [Pseudolabrys sp.]|nr:NADP-dependent oxidoreductase [Pseudolabrys sp.]
MKAILLNGHGGTELMTYGEAPDPVAGAGEVVVDIHAASINGADPKVRRGNGIYKLTKFPHILGRDFSGVVSEVGPGVTDLKVGDAVFGVLAQGVEGTYAEKVAVKADLVALKPASLSHAEAAALGLISITAIAGIETSAQLRAGQTILIQGAAGGVAGFAVQLAKHLGATVIATASAGNHDYVRSLGADKVIDYNTEDFTAIGPICDVVYDTVGGADVRARSYKVLKPGGKLVWISPGEGPQRPDVETIKPDAKRGRAPLERMKELLAAGAIKPPTIVRYKLADAAEAHRVSEGRHLQGKLVLAVR